MHLDGGLGTLKSLAGAFLSICVSITLCLFTYMKVEILLGRKDIDILTTTQI